MPQCCSVPFCSERKGGHKFPKDKTVLKQWLVAIRRENYTPTKHSRVCKKHFNPEDYVLPKESYAENPVPKLKSKTVPSRFAWNDESEERKEIKIKRAERAHRKKKRKITTVCSDTEENQCDNLSGDMMEGSDSAEAFKAVYIKQEPTDEEAPSDPKEPGVMLLSRQIKVEIEFERVEPVSVKQERVRGDGDGSRGSEAPGRDNDGAPEPKPPTAEVTVKVEPATDEPPLKDCSEGDGDETAAQTDIETNPYACEICGQKFKELYFYLPHMQLHEHNMEIVEESATKQTTFRCDTCDKVYTSKSGLYQHQQKHFCARFSCKHCDKKFTMLWSLKKHEKIHTKPYGCDMCDKSFAESSALMTHKRTHTGEKPYNCEMCEKRFAHLSDLAKHKRIHTGERPYTCEVCKKQFRCASHLVTHRKVHSSDKPHSCETCKKQFADVASLTVHKRIHTGERPFACEVCKKQFTRNSSLITHRLSHTHGRFSCKMCKKQFTQMGNLRKHVAAQHPGESTP